MRKENKGGQGIKTVVKQASLAEENHSGIVQCDGYRCWAMKGADDKWRDMQGIILEVRRVVAEF